MIQAFIFGAWYNVDLEYVPDRGGCTVLWRGRFMRCAYDQIRWISPDWYIVKRRIIS